MAQRRVETLSIAPAFDVFKGHQTCFLTCGKGLGGAFGLEGAKEALGHGIVAAVAGAAYADGDPGLGRWA